MLTYEERANDNDELVSSELRLIDGVADAVGVFWHTQADFDQRQESPGIPEKFTLKLVACVEPNALSSQALQLNYAAGRRHIKLRLFPVNPIVTMLDGPYTQPNAEISKILDNLRGPDDMTTLFAAAQIPYNFLHEELTAYHDAHPAKGVFDSINDNLAKFLQEKAKTQGPREGIWDCQTWRLERWKITLLFNAPADEFHFDVFDEGGSIGSFTELSVHSALKRRASGWAVGPFKGKGPKLLPLNGISDSDMDTLRAIASDCGIGFVIDGMTELSPLPSGTAPAQKKFLRWAAEKNPGIISGGKYDPAKK